MIGTVILRSMSKFGLHYAGESALQDTSALVIIHDLICKIKLIVIIFIPLNIGMYSACIESEPCQILWYTVELNNINLRRLFWQTYNIPLYPFYENDKNKRS